MRVPFISLIAAGSLALGGCAYDGLGLGVGYGSDYGYGYGSPYYGYGYGSPYYGYGSRNAMYRGYGYGYDDPWYGGVGYSPFGWYDNYYYPGTGYYVYDSYRRPHMWTDRQRSYWTSRQQVVKSTSRQSVAAKPNWSGFNRRQQQMQTGEERQVRNHSRQ